MGLSFEKMLVILIIAAFVIGPERLPYYASKLADLVRTARRALNSAKSQLQEELGEDFDWKQYDPRQYDPRKIIRDAILEDQAQEAAEKALQEGKDRAAALPQVMQRTAAGETVAAASSAHSAATALHEQRGDYLAVPFDTEAT